MQYRICVCLATDIHYKSSPRRSRQRAWPTGPDFAAPAVRSTQGPRLCQLLPSRYVVLYRYGLRYLHGHAGHTRPKTRHCLYSFGLLSGLTDLSTQRVVVSIICHTIRYASNGHRNEANAARTSTSERAVQLERVCMYFYRLLPFGST